MMMLGGSPISVAVPPMFDANASAIKNGAAPIASRSHTSSVTGAISNTVVTLSNRADANAVTSTSRIMMRSGEPWARLAAGIADDQRIDDNEHDDRDDAHRLSCVLKALGVSVFQCRCQ